MLLQYLLSGISLFYLTVPATEIDGYFGTRTKNAVISFQKTFGEEPTGIVTQDMWQAFYRMFDVFINTVVPMLAEASFPGYDLTVGSAGESVALMQSYIIVLSEAYPSIQKPEISGIYEQATQRAVAEIQEFSGLAPTGIIDIETWSKILELYRKNEEQKTIAMPKFAVDTYPGAPIKFGAQGSPVSAVQRMLNGVNRTLYGDKLIPEDGFFGNSTLMAAAIYQRKRGLERTGIVDKKTWNCLTQDCGKEFEA